MYLWSLSPAVELPTNSLGVMNGCPVPLHFFNIQEIETLRQPSGQLVERPCPPGYSLHVPPKRLHLQSYRKQLYGKHSLSSSVFCMKLDT